MAVSLAASNEAKSCKSNAVEVGSIVQLILSRWMVIDGEVFWMVVVWLSNPMTQGGQAQFGQRPSHPINQSPPHPTPMSFTGTGPSDHSRIEAEERMSGMLT